MELKRRSRSRDVAAIMIRVICISDSFLPLYYLRSVSNKNLWRSAPWKIPICGGNPIVFPKTGNVQSSVTFLDWPTQISLIRPMLAVTSNSGRTAANILALRTACHQDFNEGQP
jgi:hypothetical protein